VLFFPGAFFHILIIYIHIRTDDTFFGISNLAGFHFPVVTTSSNFLWGSVVQRFIFKEGKNSVRINVVGKSSERCHV
jgi:hypothetical protein